MDQIKNNFKQRVHHATFIVNTRICSDRLGSHGNKTSLGQDAIDTITLPISSRLFVFKRLNVVYLSPVSPIPTLFDLSDLRPLP